MCFPIFLFFFTKNVSLLGRDSICFDSMCSSIVFALYFLLDITFWTDIMFGHGLNSGIYDINFLNSDFDSDSGNINM